MFFKVPSDPKQCYRIPVQTQTNAFSIPSTLKDQLSYRNTWIWVDKVSKLCRNCSELLKTCRGTQTNNNFMCYVMCNVMLMWHSAKFCRCVHGMCSEYPSRMWIPGMAIAGRINLFLLKQFVPLSLCFLRPWKSSVLPIW